MKRTLPKKKIVSKTLNYRFHFLRITYILHSYQFFLFFFISLISAILIDPFFLDILPEKCIIKKNALQRDQRKL